MLKKREIPKQLYPHRFKKGHAMIKGAGRKPGTPNKTTRLLKEAAIMAAEAVGSDGKGKEGLIGYLKFVATEYPASFTTLLCRILPIQIKTDSSARVDVVYTTKEEVITQLQARGIPCKQLFGPN